jgi:hypothetical protein
MSPPGPESRRPSPADARAAATLLRELRRSFAASDSADGSRDDADGETARSRAADAVSAAWRRLGESPCIWWLAISASAAGAMASHVAAEDSEAWSRLLGRMLVVAGQWLAAGLALLVIVTVIAAPRGSLPRAWAIMRIAPETLAAEIRRRAEGLSASTRIWMLILGGWAVGMALLAILVLIAR